MKNKISFIVLSFVLWTWSISEAQQDSFLNTDLEAIIGETNLDTLVHYVNILSGEDSVAIRDSTYLLSSRASDHPHNDLAAEFIKQTLARLPLVIEDQGYSSTGRNILAIQAGTEYPDQEYIICAHYDAVTSYCADDNASSVSAVLEAARILSKFKTDYTIIYAFWDEEEVGLLGSDYYATEANATNENIRGLINLEMLGWDGNGDNLIDIHTRDIGNSMSHANTVNALNADYEIGLSPTILNPGVTASDHGPFWRYGYSAIVIGEAFFSGDGNPYYHTSQDKIDKFNLAYYHKLSKLAVATISHFAVVNGVRAVPPQISVDADTLNFGQVFVGDSLSLELKVRNTGSEPLLILSAVVQPAIYNVTPASASIGAGTMQVFTISFSPRDVAHFAGIMTLTSNDPVNETLAIVLTGTGIEPPSISVHPDSIEVVLDIGQTMTKILTISNFGASDLHFNIPPAIGSGGNYALEFDGIDDEAVLGDNSSLDILGDISICTWFKTETSQWGSLVSNFDQHWPDNGYQLCIGSRNDEGGFVYFEVASNDRRDGFSTNTSFHDGDWHFIAAVLSPDGLTRVRVFVDATEQSGYFHRLGRPVSEIGATPAYPLKLGASSNRTGPEALANFKGNIDEVSIWNIALTQAEIQVIMNSGLTGTETGLVGYWPVDESSGDTIYDEAGDNDGILLGGVTRVRSTAPVLNWLLVSPNSGTCVPKSSTEVQIIFDACRVDAGNYYSNLIIRCNDPITPELTIPLHLKVSPVVGIGGESTVPKKFALHPNYPNPFNSETEIRFQIPQASDVTLKIYNLFGQEIRTLSEKTYTPGEYSVRWDGQDNFGKSVASGIYLYRLQTETFTQVRKMALIK